MGTVTNKNTITKDEFSSSLPLTAFDDLRVAELTPIVQYSFEYTVTNTDLGIIEVAGSGAVTQANAMCVVSTGTTTSSTAEWESSRHVKYKSGLGGSNRFTAMFTAGVAGTEQMVGLADTEGASASHVNGFAVGYDGANFAFLRYQNDVLFPIHQTDWDDPMDGSGPSGMTLDPTKLNVYIIQFAYLGAGPLRLWISSSISGRMVLAHTLIYTNSNTTPSIYNPNFHLMAHALNRATTSDLIVKSASMAYFIEGRSNISELQQPQETTGQRTKTTVTTEVAIFTIRNKATYASKVNFIDIKLENLTVAIEANSANNLGRFRLVRNASLGGSPSYADINTTNSLVDIDVAGTTVTGGTELIGPQMAGKNDREITSLTDFDFIITPGDTVTLAGLSANSATMSGSLLWKELF